MKKIILLIINGLFVLSTAHAANTYAPRLESVVVLHDASEDDFSPFLFHFIMGEALDMKMDPSCSRIHINVKTQEVNCASASGSTIVGSLGAKIGQVEEWSVLQVKWRDNVEIVQRQERNGRISYSVHVKN